MLESYGRKRPWFDDGIEYDGNHYFAYGNGFSIYLCFNFLERGDGFESGLRGFITGEDKELMEEIHAKILKYIE